jgi:hypothetical protein
MMENSTVEKRNGSQRQAAGFVNLLDELVRSISRTDTLARVARTILTLKRRQPYSIALQGLTTRQHALLSLMGKAIPEWTPPPFENPGAVWHIGIWNYGRIFLSDAVVDSHECNVFAWLRVPDDVSRQIDAQVRAAEAKGAKYEEELEAFWANVTEAEKREIVEKVRDGIDHIDPVLIYVNDATFTNFGPYNNLLRKPGALLERLTDTPIAEWLPDEKRFVGCFYWVLRATFRGEELNGLQLTPCTLHAHFDERFRRYCQLLGTTTNEWPESLFDKAKLLSQMRPEIARNHLMCRWVNGLTFYKAERFVKRSVVKQSADKLPIDLRNYIEGSYGLRVSSFANLEDVFRACIEVCAENKAENVLLDSVEQLLERITLSAIEAVRSDIGMTRGIRDIRRWQEKLDAERFVEIGEWPTTDYFCGVFPSAEMRVRIPDPTRLAKVLTACSVRMQYNSWHYMPGHFAKELAPHHFYFPPRMPDTAIWSDQHHAGHVMAAVRFSIRSPAPLKYQDRTYFGMVDLRLFRTTGPHYTRKDLCEAVKYTEYVRAVWQAISDMAASGERRIVIRAFDKGWFERYCTALVGSPNILQTQTTGAS